MSRNPKKPGPRSESEQPSNHLWVGSLPFDISESGLAKLFDKYGVIDGIHSHASRNYAFVYYKNLEDAVAAKDALQGFLVDGNRIKIEFAKPAKPSTHVWIGGFHSSTAKEKLEEEFSKFGEIEDFKFNRDRNTALVNFVRLEDACAAVKSLNGMQIGDDRVRVDFMRAQPIRRETDFIDMGRAQFKGMGGFDSSWMDPDIMRNYPEPTYSGHKRPQPHSVRGRKTDNPSKVLWVGYPPSIVIDEEMLHNAMILHGEIEKIKCYPDRHYSFVEFRSIDEARRAKEALEGRLFNDPRIAIMFSNSNLAPGKDFGPPLSGFRGQRPDMYGNEGPFRPLLMDMFPPNLPMAPFSFSGPNGMIRPFVPRGNLDPLLATPDFHDHSVRSDLVDMNHRKSSPPGAGLLPSPALPGRSVYKKSGWDVVDPNHPPRGPKRTRIDGPTYHKPSLTAVQVDEYADQPHGSRPPFGSGAFPRDQAGSDLSRGDIGVAKGHDQGHGNDDYIWRGVIAKGGTPVCRARCIPIGNGLEFELPEVVNCSARTGLDMLAKHYAAAFEFDIVFFLPDSEDDFANYTEFLRYLGSKNRAGVAKLDNGTTLFLVPPSDFLTDVLKVTGRERLYGVVLKMQPSVPIVAPLSQQLHQPLPSMQQMGRQLVPPTHESVVSKQDFPVQMDYNTAEPEVAVPPRVSYPTTSVPQAQSNVIISSASGPSLSLTAELIASLQSLQSATQSSIAQSALKNVGSLTTGPPPPISSNEGGVYSWSQQPQIHAQTGQPSHSFGVQSYTNAPVTNTFQSFPTNQNVSSHQVPSIPENMSMQNHAYNLQEQGHVASRPALTHPVTVAGQQFVPLTQGTQPYSFEAPHNAQKNYVMMHGTAGSYGVADNSQQPNYPGSYPNQSHEGISSHPDSTRNSKPESLNLVERLQPGPSGVGGQGTAEVEADKNQRYQNTLQFAANLLLQIQQQQQQQQGSSNMGNQK